MMLGMFTNKKKISELRTEAPFPMEGESMLKLAQMQACEEALKAIEAKDARALLSALRSFHAMACYENEENEENSESESSEYE